MIEFKFKNIIVAFDFSFFAIVSLLILLSGNNYAVLGLAACLWHEFGHFVAMNISSVRIKRLVFYGAGIKIIPNNQMDFTSFGTKLLILASGSVFNFVAALLFSLCSAPSAVLFAAINAVIGAFNLLPLRYLDGGKIITEIIYCLCGFQQACLLERYLKWLNVMLIMIVLTAFAVAGQGNVTLYITLCYLLFSAISY